MIGNNHNIGSNVKQHEIQNILNPWTEYMYLVDDIHSMIYVLYHTNRIQHSRHKSVIIINNNTMDLVCYNKPKTRKHVILPRTLSPTTISNTTWNYSINNYSLLASMKQGSWSFSKNLIILQESLCWSLLRAFFQMKVYKVILWFPCEFLFTRQYMNYTFKNGSSKRIIVPLKHTAFDRTWPSLSR